MPMKGKPHLVPSKLVGQRYARDTFGDTKIALVGYCPPPSRLGKYAPVPTTDQYFIHVTPDSVKRFSHNGINFLALFHVYGGPVSSSTIEELAYYDLDYILAYGLAGGLGTKNLRMGDFYLIEDALVTDGTTPHYTTDKVIAADAGLKTKIQALWRDGKPLHPVRAITGDAIYREDDAYLDEARRQGCDIVNLDTTHLYAVSQWNSEDRQMRTVECGVISDVAGGGDAEGWDSTLSVMLSARGGDALNPLELTGDIVEFYVERLAPVLLGRQGA